MCYNNIVKRGQEPHDKEGLTEMFEQVKATLAHFVGIDNGLTVQYTLEQDVEGDWYFDVKCDYDRLTNVWTKANRHEWTMFEQWLEKNCTNCSWYEMSYNFGNDHFYIDILED